MHSINEQQTYGSILSEERLKDNITSEQLDLFGKILDTDDGVLGDLKITSSFKLMKALGIYKQKMDAGEVYKSGLKKGRAKFRSELRYDGVRDLRAIQLATRNVSSTARPGRIVPTLKVFPLQRRKAMKNFQSRCRVFTLECAVKTNSITPHVRYISPDNVLQDL